MNHAADLIKKKLIRENDRPDKAAKFSNLYSRLLSQPVLYQKWAILYFMYQLADDQVASSHASNQQPSPHRTMAPDVEANETRAGAELRRAGTARMAAGRHERQYSVDSPAFNEAFSRNGLPRLQTTEDRDATRPSSARSAREKAAARSSLSRPPVEPPVEPIDEPASQPAIPRPDAPSEAQLLRDLPFTLQGLSSANLVFADKASLALPRTLPVPLISLLHTLAEPSLLYKSLARFVDSSEGGLVAQSLRSAIGTELRAYLGLVATLEGQIRRALTQLAEIPGKQGLGKAGVTLKRCIVWTREATMGLRLMSMIVEESKGERAFQSVYSLRR